MFHNKINSSDRIKRKKNDSRTPNGNPQVTSRGFLKIDRLSREFSILVSSSAAWVTYNATVEHSRSKIKLPPQRTLGRPNRTTRIQWLPTSPLFIPNDLACSIPDPAASASPSSTNSNRKLSFPATLLPHLIRIPTKLYPWWFWPLPNHPPLTFCCITILLHIHPCNSLSQLSVVSDYVYLG